MDQRGEVGLEPHQEQLAGPAYRPDRKSLDRGQRRIVGTQRIDARRQRRLDPRSRDGRADHPRGDLHFRQLWHPATSLVHAETMRELFEIVQALFTRARETDRMSDLLAIVGPSDTDSQLLEEIANWRPDRVTVLLEDGDRDWAFDDSLPGLDRRERIAELLARIEQQTGATVVGLVGDSDQLRGWRFDRVIAAHAALAA